MKKLYILPSVAALFLFACNEEGSVENQKEIGSAVAQVQSNSEERSLEKENDIETIVTEALYIKHDNEPDLNEYADMVVIAHTVKDFKDRTHVVEYDEYPGEDNDFPPTIGTFHTETPIKIMKVLKQPSDSNIAKNETINIIEPTALLEDESGVKKITIGNYVELQKGKPYILYLKKNTYGQYGIINMNNGKFNLEGTNEEIKDGDINIEEEDHDLNKAEHQELKKAVEKKFEKEIKEVKNN